MFLSFSLDGKGSSWNHLVKRAKWGQSGPIRVNRVQFKLDQSGSIWVDLNQFWPIWVIWGSITVNQTNWGQTGTNRDKWGHTGTNRENGDTGDKPGRTGYRVHSLRSSKSYFRQFPKLCFMSITKAKPLLFIFQIMTLTYKSINCIHLV